MRSSFAIFDSIPIQVSTLNIVFVCGGCILLAPAIMMSRLVQHGAERGNNRPQRAPIGGNGGAPVAPRPPPAPPEEAIAQLTGMGFDRQAVIRALQQSDNNVEGAANRLLMG